MDQSNIQFWRQNPRRLEGEVIRDSLLAYSGLLNLQMGGPGVYPELVEDMHQTQDSAGKGWGRSPPSQQYRRSIYIFVKRALPYPLLEAFDLSTTASPIPQRPVTTVAPQALLLLNDQFVQTTARSLAERLEVADPIKHAFQIVLQRSPTSEEAQQAAAFLKEHQRLSNPTSPSGHAQLCVALLNLNETIYVD